MNESLKKSFQLKIDCFKSKREENNQKKMRQNSNCKMLRSIFVPAKQKPKEPEKVFKPIGNWHKILKINADKPLSKVTVDQVFKNVLPSYAPRVPRNTSQRCIDSLTSTDLEQLHCPGCKDRFLLPTSFFQHIYRRSCRISFDCVPCGQMVFFHNRCHLRLHVLSHLGTFISHVDIDNVLFIIFFFSSIFDQYGFDKYLKRLYLHF